MAADSYHRYKVMQTKSFCSNKLIVKLKYHTWKNRAQKSTSPAKNIPYLKKKKKIQLFLFIYVDYNHCHKKKKLNYVYNAIFLMWQEDIKLLKEMNADSYRFSISWPRVIPCKASLCKPLSSDGLLSTHFTQYGIYYIVTKLYNDLQMARLAKA